MKDTLKLYFVCGTVDCSRKNILTVVEEALQAGITLFQFREKGFTALQGKEKIAMAKQLQILCKQYQVPFIIDDDIDLVELIDADGLHIGQNDLPVDEARRRLPDKIIGLSVSTMAEYQKSQLSVVDYIGIGPFNPTQSKADAKPAVGNRTTKAVREINQDIPIVAIGGITSDFVHDIIESGTDGIAVISAISKANHIVDATRQLRYEVEKALVNRQKHSDVTK
ncbi:TPA: thiamine phosphate synthase [Streptococcus agalactiae]